jgi:hypothetical protein
MRGMNALSAKALGALAALISIMAALIFIPSATLNYWQAWLFLARVSRYQSRTKDSIVIRVGLLHVSAYPRAR